jgi:phosphatidylglycerol:prolipoprotein diacylglycerol transferase
MIWVHNLSPFALQFSEHFGVRWYGLAYLAGFLCGYYAIVRMTKRGGTLFRVDQVADFITFTAIGVLVGGRLGYAAFYAPDLFTSLDSQFPYWGVLKVNEGGMASHGGILGVMIVCYVYGRYMRIPFWHCLDLTVFGGSLGFCFGRIANFVNGELYGREAPAGLSWAVKFPSEMLTWPQHDPQRLRSLGPAVEVLGQLHVPGGETIALNTTTWLSWVDSTSMSVRQHIYETLEALIAAVQAHNAAVTEALAPILVPRYPSQLIQSVLEGLLVFLILCWIWRRPQKPAVVSAWFGVLYCSARIVGEQFRMPDAHLGFQLWGLTRGQWLSIGLLAVAIVVLIWAYRRKIPRMGGWNP